MFGSYGCHSLFALFCCSFHVFVFSLLFDCVVVLLFLCGVLCTLVVVLVLLFGVCV